MYPLLATPWVYYYKQYYHARTSSLCPLAYLILLGNMVATLCLFCIFPLLFCSHPYHHHRSLLPILHHNHYTSINMIQAYSQIMHACSVSDHSSFDHPPAPGTMHVTPLFVERKHKRWAFFGINVMRTTHPSPWLTMIDSLCLNTILLQAHDMALDHIAYYTCCHPQIKHAWNYRHLHWCVTKHSPRDKLEPTRSLPHPNNGINVLLYLNFMVIRLSSTHSHCYEEQSKFDVAT